MTIWGIVGVEGGRGEAKLEGGQDRDLFTNPGDRNVHVSRHLGDAVAQVRRQRAPGTESGGRRSTVFRGGAAT